MSIRKVWVSTQTGEFPEVEFTGSEKECEEFALERMASFDNYVESDASVWIENDEDAS